MWKKSYFDIRAQIEASGRDQRWEFDRKRLFEKTDYMASICQDLYDIVQVVMCVVLNRRIVYLDSSAVRDCFALYCIF